MSEHFCNVVAFYSCKCCGKTFPHTNAKQFVSMDDNVFIFGQKHAMQAIHECYPGTNGRLRQFGLAELCGWESSYG